MSKINASTLSALLSYPYQTGVLDISSAGKTLIWGASYWTEAQEFNDFDIANGFYPDTQSWKTYDIGVQPEIPENIPYQSILISLPKQKEASLYRLAKALQQLEFGGVIVAVAANDAGGKRLGKWFKEFGLTPSSASKSKCRIVWATKDNSDISIITKHVQAGERQSVMLESASYITQAGIYGWNKIDQGSKLLMTYVPENLSGIGADFGCGYGYLSSQILGRPNKVKKLYAYDADYQAVQCAKENLKGFDVVECQWCDLTASLQDIPPLDFIVMNPPFHEGKNTKTALGQNFIENAAKALKKNGTLYMVANTHLPYEKTLIPLFSQIEKCDETQGFKVYKAIK